MELSKARVRLLRRIVARKGREAEGVVLVEGPRAIETAMESGADLLFALHSGFSEAVGPLLPRLAASGVEIFEVSEEEFAEFAQTETPQGLLALAREPQAVLPDPARAGRERVLLLDRVQDPGNVGTLIRAAAALDVSRVLLLDGTADAWGAKAVRASAGLTFHLPLHSLRWEAAADWIATAGIPLLVADAAGEDVRIWIDREGEAREQDPDGSRTSGWALLIGNEGEGPRREALDRADALLSIPLAPGVESLNAAMAGAILLWALGPGRARTA